MRIRMTWIRRAGLALLLSGAPIVRASGQGGGCFGSFEGECVMLRSTVGRGAAQQQSVRTVVLWRRPSPEPTDTGSWAALDARWNAFNADASRRGFSLGGGHGGAYAFVAFSYVPQTRVIDSVFVGGERIAVPARDTVLVVLVDQLTTATRDARVERVLLIATAAMPAFPFRQWTEGGRVVSAGAAEAELWQRELFRRSPEVIAFLRRAP